MLGDILVDHGSLARPVGPAPDIGADEFAVPQTGRDEKIYLPIVN